MHCVLAIRKVKHPAVMCYNAWTCYGPVEIIKINSLKELLIRDYGENIIAFAIIKIKK
jgi:hypothetical protein